MKSTWRTLGVLGLLALALTAPLRGQSFGFPWWREAQFQRDLSLTAEQSNKIDAVFQKTIPILREKKSELDAQEEDVGGLSHDGAEAHTGLDVGVGRAEPQRQGREQGGERHRRGAEKPQVPPHTRILLRNRSPLGFCGPRFSCSNF